MKIPIHIMALGCARNDVDSEEIAARLNEAGFELVDDSEAAEVVVVNTCGFIEAAKTESISAIIELKQQASKRPVVVTGCLAQRFGTELADSLSEADAVIGFDGYPKIVESIKQVMAGHRVVRHGISGQNQTTVLPGWLPSYRHRLSNSPSAPLKVASGCDRRCGFCAIPSIRGPFQSRPVADIVSEARWLATQQVKELFLVSENTTAYGKDLLDRRSLASVLRQLSGLDGIEWIRLSYLQPDEVRPWLIEAIATIPKVVPYFDLPFQHGSASVLTRMRRFGDPASFLGLLDQVRCLLPQAGIRANFIVGFPGETESDIDTLKQFLVDAHLDAIGIFSYSDEEGTPAASLDHHLDIEEISARTNEVSIFADTMMSLRAEARIGQVVEVLIESNDGDNWIGRSAQQGPEDGQTQIRNQASSIGVGDTVTGRLAATQGVDWFIDI